MLPYQTVAKRKDRNPEPERLVCVRCQQEISGTPHYQNVGYSDKPDEPYSKGPFCNSRCAELLGWWLDVRDMP
jgi:hypothetical protein